jgi:hypothetical protein
VAIAPITANPSDLGATVNNWLGRAQYLDDPTFDGRLDDVVLSCTAYSDEEIGILANPSVVCGDGSCDALEDCGSCAADCGACPVCGDGTCAASEGCGSCAADCGECIDDTIANYPMDGGSGTTAVDISGNLNDGTLMSGASFTSAGLLGGAVDINGGAQHVDLPDGLVSQCDDFTFAAWVWLDSNPGWNRIFDFGSDTSTYMFLSPEAGGNTLRFAIKEPTFNGGFEQQLSFPLNFPLATWTHVAVVLEADTGTLFVGGAPVAIAFK